MKALEILKEEERKLRFKWDEGFMTYAESERHKSVMKSIEELTTLQSNYEAQESIIADLKKQLKPKSCDGCKHEHTFKSICFMCLRTSPDYYTPKDNQ